MNVRLNYNLSFTAGVFYNGSMIMNSYHVRVWLTTNHSDPASQNIAFERLKYFVYNTLDSSIFINSENQEQCQKYADAGIKITTLPGDPVDQLIGIVLHCKLKSIMEDRILIDETEISSSLGEHITYLHCEGETVNLSQYPDWCLASDLSHYDSTLVETDNVLSMPKAGAWRDLDLAWPDESEQTVTSPPTGNTIVFADFKRSDET